MQIINNKIFVLNTIKSNTNLQDPIGYAVNSSNVVTGITEMNILSVTEIIFNTQISANNNTFLSGVKLFGFHLDSLPLKITNNKNKNTKNYKFKK